MHSLQDHIWNITGLLIKSAINDKASASLALGEHVLCGWDCCPPYPAPCSGGVLGVKSTRQTSSPNHIFLKVRRQQIDFLSWNSTKSSWFHPTYSFVQGLQTHHLHYKKFDVILCPQKFIWYQLHCSQSLAKKINIVPLNSQCMYHPLGTLANRCKQWRTRQNPRPKED